MCPSHEYHDSLWKSVRPGATPEQAQRRERFLLAAMARENARLERPLRALDLGCGDGHFALALSRAGALVCAADVSTEALRRARERVPGLATQLIAADAALPFGDASFDLVWSGETIEHVADTAGWLSEVRRVLRPRALLLLSTPDHGVLTRLCLALSGSAFAAHFDPRADHLRFYTRRVLRELLADFGFEEVEVAGVAGVPGARRVLLGSARRTRF